MFVTDGYNFRNTEFGAVIGLSQLPRLNSMIERRREVCDRFVSILKKYSKIFDIPNFEGNSSFCLPFILKDKTIKPKLQKYIEENGVETRPLCSGNLLRQPFLKDYKLGISEPMVDYLHFHGFFIGNNHLVSDKDIDTLEELITEYFG
jgi:CDP-6-deoxy-D-xylo-4-hexulose-3-dehydrase